MIELILKRNRRNRRKIPVQLQRRIIFASQQATRIPYVSVPEWPGSTERLRLIARDKSSLPACLQPRSVPLLKRGGSSAVIPLLAGHHQFRSISFRAVPMSAKHPAAHYGPRVAANGPPPWDSITPSNARNSSLRAFRMPRHARSVPPFPSPSCATFRNFGAVPLAPRIPPSK